ncbi:D-glycero-alpha-D-manno-heptose-1,7-bisphosphate 7-phosphatase [Chondrinema litorale]|uniref:D-glycero-alpha-D-manno-heptose-1,7-bisphosphate 7-phosphatase n=1 Tax=Chondrinema litorale TaxID=2994555 RepID=UPI00254306AE|nr:HAD-IIIA family hydrolase [Chondrinema litorale]UZR93952.1 HAD-IIIA family hydrolase [Chondrinema litorale]
MNKCIFLDRDGVLNVERGEYSYKPENFIIEYNVPEALEILKKQGYCLVVITNQAGIAKGLYSAEDVLRCHETLQNSCKHIIDKLYFSPYHPHYTESLSRKPDSLMFEKAIAKFNIDPEKSFMIGDKERDLIPAKKLNINTVLVAKNQKETIADFTFENLYDFSQNIELIEK